MKKSLIIRLFLSGYLFICDECSLSVKGGHDVSVNAGEDVALNCSVDPSIAPEQLEVSWKKVDENITLLMFQKGKVENESTPQRYKDRVKFFSQEEIQKGNFSLRLKDLRLEDKGLYICEVFYGKLAANTTVKVQLLVRSLSVKGGHDVSVNAGEDVALNCSVDPSIAPEQLEVSWKKVDENITLLMFQEGKVKNESTPQRYKDRVKFFSQEEIQKGNFSLRLKDLRLEDKGLYICEVFSEELAANTTVKVQLLGFSSMHIGIFCLCVLALLLCALAVWPAWQRSTSLGTNVNDNNSRKTSAIQLTLVICPNIAMFLAFIFWGATEGSFIEAATCSALNLLRILSLFRIAPYLDTFQETIQRFIKRSTVALEYAVVATLTYSGFYQQIKSAFLVTRVWALVLLIILLLFFMNIFIQGLFERFSKTHSIWNYGFAEVANFGRVAVIGFLNSGYNKASTVIAFLPYLPLVLTFGFQYLNTFLPSVFAVRTWRLLGLIWMSVLLSLEVLNASLSVYIHDVILQSDQESVVITYVAAYLYILTVMLLLEHLSCVCAHLYTVSNSDSTKRHQSLGLLHTSVYRLGAVGLIVVNSVALVVELILKARNGKGTVDLRVVFMPVECGFALCCLALQISSFGRTYGANLVSDLKGLCRLWSCQLVSKDRTMHTGELGSLQSARAAPAPQELES